MAKKRGLLTAGQLAKRLGMSPQTIAVWRGDGMPHEGRDARGYFYDEAACRRWRAENATGGSDGGKRPGAGRKPKGFKGPAKAAPVPAPVTPDAATPGTRAFAERQKAEWAARKSEIEVRKAEGELIDADEAETSAREYLACVARAIHGAPVRTAAALAAELKLDQAGMLRVKAILEREADETARRLTDDAKRTLGAVITNADLGGATARSPGRGDPPARAAAG